MHGMHDRCSEMTIQIHRPPQKVCEFIVFLPGYKQCKAELMCSHAALFLTH